MFGMSPIEIYTPAWVRDAVFYQIFPDRFAKSRRVPKPSNLERWNSLPTVNGYKGGDLMGVVEKLDYLEELGVNALYLNPIFQSASNHRYHTHDYYRVDPMLGGDKALRTLLDEAHARGMKVVLDGVFNHASRGFFQFSDILENGERSAYLDWFRVRRFPLNAYGGGDIGYDAWWNLPALPEFNTDTRAVREFLWGIGSYWLEQGIDGWRLDVPSEIDDDSFWREFRRRCRMVNPECYLVGEIWEEAHRWLQGDQFDAVMNYPFARTALGFVASRLNDEEIAKSGYHEIVKLNAEAFGREVQALLTRYPREITEVQFNLLGSHDTPRVLTLLGGDEEALRLALLLLFTFPGTPCLYYGDEIGMRGAHDPGCRRGMPWSPGRWNQDLRRYIRRLIALRKRHPALRTGGFDTLHAVGELFVFSRRDEEATLIVLLNSGGPRRDLALPLELEQTREMGGRYRDALGDTGAEVRGGRLMVEALSERTGLLLERVSSD